MNLSASYSPSASLALCPCFLPLLAPVSPAFLSSVSVLTFFLLSTPSSQRLSFSVTLSRRGKRVHKISLKLPPSLLCLCGSETRKWSLHHHTFTVSELAGAATLHSVFKGEAVQCSTSGCGLWKKDRRTTGVSWNVDLFVTSAQLHPLSSPLSPVYLVRCCFNWHEEKSSSYLAACSCFMSQLFSPPSLFLVHHSASLCLCLLGFPFFLSVFFCFSLSASSFLCLSSFSTETHRSPLIACVVSLLFFPPCLVIYISLPHTSLLNLSLCSQLWLEIFI